MVSTVGFGDISPKTNTEKMFSIVAQLVGCFIFMICCSELSAVMMSKRELERRGARKINEVRDFLSNRKVPIDLRKEICTFLTDTYQRTIFDEQQMLTELPRGLRHSLNDEIHKDLRSTAFFEAIVVDEDPDLVSALCCEFRPMFASYRQVIYTEGSLAFEFFVIEIGEVSLSMGEGAGPVPFERCLKSGTFFGERELFYSRKNTRSDDHGVLLKDRRRHQTAWATSQRVTCLHFLPWDRLMHLRGQSASLYHKIRTSAAERVRQDHRRPGPPGPAKRPCRFPQLIGFLWRFLYGRSGRLTAKNGGFRPGQTSGSWRRRPAPAPARTGGRGRAPGLRIGLAPTLWD